MTLARSLIEMHGGSILGKSAGLGRGSEFVISLPLARDDGVPELAAAEEIHKPLQKAYRVLVVDDNHDGAIALARLLNVLGYETRVAHDGTSAIELARKEVPDAVLMDIGLPGMDGYEAAKQIRNDEKGKAMLLVAITGYGQEEDRRRSVEAGFDFHLIKPVDFGALTSLLSGRTSNTPYPLAKASNPPKIEFLDGSG